MTSSNIDTTPESDSLAALVERIRGWGRELGFNAIGIHNTDLSPHDQYLREWLERGDHADMDYMERHGSKRWTPEELVEGTRRIISARMDYFSADAEAPLRVLDNPEQAYISRYALGRDYHKLMRARLAQLADRIRSIMPESQQRVFTDSAPVLERGIAEKAGLGWIGKNTMLIHPRAGSWFFLGEIYTSLPLPVDDAFDGYHCGSCTACLSACPTGAFRGPHQLDSRRCISYLTIEHFGPIPVELRPLIGNRIYGCDDCQLVCPWNKFTQPTTEKDFSPRHQLDAASLLELFNWDEEQFLQNLQGSPIRRIGHDRWLRNIAVALGNGPATADVISALEMKRTHPSALVREHVEWALETLKTRR